MIQFSVLIPQRDRGDDVRRQLPELAAALEPFGQPYEIIVVDDGSQSPTLRLLEKLSKEFHALRLLRLDEPGGVSAALSVAIQAARGETIIATEAGRCYPAEQIASLIEWLPRADMIVGRRRRFGVPKLRERIARIPRWLLLGLESHDPDCLFWAARREGVPKRIALSRNGSISARAGGATGVPDIRNVCRVPRPVATAARCAPQSWRFARRLVVLSALAESTSLRTCSGS